MATRLAVSFLILRFLFDSTSTVSYETTETTYGADLVQIVGLEWGSFPRKSALKILPGTQSEKYFGIS